MYYRQEVIALVFAVLKVGDAIAVELANGRNPEAPMIRYATDTDLLAEAMKIAKAAARS